MKSAPSLESLLLEAGWIRRLAAKLVRDEATADDLVQETWLAALRGAPAERERQKPWLARVLVNFARQHERAGRRRASRELAAARPEEAPVAEDTAERLETQKQLVEALSDLPEPERSIVMARYYDGLSSAEIARRLGLPAGTVRWRLKQGIDDLRARLDDRFDGDRRAWCLALLPLAREAPLVSGGAIVVGLSPTLMQGMIAMNTLTKLSIAAALALSASVGVWIATDRQIERVEPLAHDVRPGARADLEADGGAAALAGPLEGDAAARAAVAPEAHEPARAAPVATPERARLEMRFLDSAERPVEGVRVTLAALPGVAVPASDAEGRIGVDLDASASSSAGDLVASRAGYATYFGSVRLERARTTYVGDVELEPGGSVAGIVLGPDGAPVRDAQVLVASPEIARDLEQARRTGPALPTEVPRARTQADGSFRIDGARAGLARVWASTKDTRWGFSEPVEVPVDAVVAGVELRLAPLAAEDEIAGVVLSPEGEPVPGADVRYRGRAAGSTYSGNFRAGADGRFRHRVTVLGPHDFQVHDGEDRWPDLSVLDVAPGTRDLVLTFPPTRWIEVSVGVAGAESVDRFVAAVLSADGARTLRAGKHEDHPGGLARLAVPTEPFVVEVRARGLGTAVLGPFAPDAAPPSVRCLLERRPGIRGRVTAAKEPVAGARVRLHEIAGPETSIERDGFPTRLHPDPEDSTTTDADGWFELDATRPSELGEQRFFRSERGAASTFAVLADAEGWAVTETAPLEIDPALGLDGIEIELVRGGAIEGRVLTAPGRDAAGVVVAVDRADGRPQSQRVGPEGRYRFEHLAPGRWNVSRAAAETGGESSSTAWSSGKEIRAEYPTNCTVADGETTRFDLDLSDVRPCVLLAQVSVNAHAAAGWTATLRSAQRATTKGTLGGAVDAEGRLRLEAPSAGDWVLVLEPPPRKGSMARFEVPVAVGRGDNAVPIDLRVGTIRGACASPAGTEIVAWSREVGAAAGNAGARVDDEGRFEIPFVQAGRSRAMRLGLAADGKTQRTLAEVEVVVPAGGVVEVVMP